MSVSNSGSFLWGVATSSYQVEGGIVDNDWDYFTSQEDIKKRISSLTRRNRFYKNIKELSLEPAGNAVKAWEPEFYLKDFDNASGLGLNAFRISLEWARIQPRKNEWDLEAIDHYKQMIRSMRERNLTPVVALNHFTLPLWISTPPTKFIGKKFQKLLPQPYRSLPLGEPDPSDPYWQSMTGWESADTITMFVKYVERVVTELKDQVDHWITMTEPMGSIVGGGYLAGIFPPGFFLDGKRARTVIHNVIEAHVKAYDMISATDDIDADGDGIAKLAGFSHLMVIVKPVAARSEWKKT